MQLEFNELALRYAELWIAEPGRQARLDRSSGREGQQSRVLVMVADGVCEGGDEVFLERFVVADGFDAGALSGPLTAALEPSRVEGMARLELVVDAEGRSAECNEGDNGVGIELEDLCL